MAIGGVENVCCFDELFDLGKRPGVSITRIGSKTKGKVEY